MAELDEKTLVAMDDIHEIGPEPWWREAWYFAFYDQKAQIGATSYCGIFPNQERADLMFDIVRDERSAHRFFDLGLTIRKDVGKEREQLGPQSVEMIEAGKRWGWQFDHDGHAVNIEFEATEPLFSWADAGITMEQFDEAPSKHTDQAGRFRGNIIVGDERIEVDAIGMRDRMWGWGGRKDWLNYCMMWAPFEDGTIVNISCMQFADGRVELAGHITKDGKRSLIEQGRIVFNWDPDRWKSITHIDSWVRDGLGREATLLSRPVAWIDTGNRWRHRYDNLLWSTGRHDMDGMTAYGCTAWSYMKRSDRPNGFEVGLD